jgi:hypothetical protein
MGGSHLMLRRVTASLVLALIGLVAVCVPALAGGFAVTTLDEAPQDLRANQTYRIGYTIRQHGITPVVSASTRIVAQLSATGDTTAFVGSPEGPAGHYVAEVRFPSAGMWSWQVEQGPFAPQQLGSIVVEAAAVAAPDPARLDVLDLSSLRPILPLAAVLSSLVFVWQLALRVRSARPRPRVRLSS